MRKRFLLIAAPLVVVAIAASVAVASPSDAEHSRGLRLDNLHAERPIAASDSNATLSVTDAGFQKAAKDIQDFVIFREQQLDEYLRILSVEAVGDYIAARQAAEAAEAARLAAESAAEPAAQLAAQSAAQSAAQQPVSEPVYSTTDPGDFLSCVRNRESGGDYSIYNSGGSGAAGAYQFLPGTWDSTAASSGRGDLVGVDPAQASPADQDAMAQALYAQQGSAPWGGAC